VARRAIRPEADPRTPLWTAVDADAVLAQLTSPGGR
jgi:hypothetical protein